MENKEKIINLLNQYNKDVNSIITLTNNMKNTYKTSLLEKEKLFPSDFEDVLDLILERLNIILDNTNNLQVLLK